MYGSVGTMVWRPESEINAATLALIHECLHVSGQSSSQIFYVGELAYVLKQWVRTERSSVPISLADMSIPGTILTLVAAVETLERLEYSLPSAHWISRDYGVILEGERRPRPEINTDFDPREREIHNGLEQLMNGFEMILSIMNLLGRAVQDSFWEEVARAQGVVRPVSGEEIKQQWDSTQQGMQSSLTDMRSFVAHTQTAIGSVNPEILNSTNITPRAKLTTLIEQLRAFTV